MACPKNHRMDRQNLSTNLVGFQVNRQNLPCDKGFVAKSWQNTRILSHILIDHHNVLCKNFTNRFCFNRCKSTPNNFEFDIQRLNITPNNLQLSDSTASPSKTNIHILSSSTIFFKLNKTQQLCSSIFCTVTCSWKIHELNHQLLCSGNI